MSNFFTAVFVIVLAVVLIVFLPLLSIWAVNTLFGTAIPFNVATWFASLWLSAVVGGKAVSSK